MSAPSPDSRPRSHQAASTDAAVPAAAPFARWIVFGAGALGSLFGARVSSQLPVLLVARPAHAQAVADQGLEIVATAADALRTSTHIQNDRLTAAVQLPPLRAGDAVGVFCKTGGTSAAAAAICAAIRAGATSPTALQAPPAVGPSAPPPGVGPSAPPPGVGPIQVWTFQNGLDNAAILRRAFADLPAAQQPEVHVAIAICGATLEAPGRVADYGGYFALPDTPAGHGLGRLLSAAGLAAEFRADIPAELWRKLALNCVVNPLTILLRRRNRFILAPELAALRAAVIAEVAAVARAEGVELEPAALLAHMETAMAPSWNFSSMYQDRLRHERRLADWEAAGRPGDRPRLKTEIEALNGAVVEGARRAGLTAPANRALLELVRFLEAV
ncbi:MAG: ketopantoate reductase family protein [Planctomycetota bacterium]